MDSEKLQTLANLAVVRQHAAAVTASTNFNRKYIAKVNAAIGALDVEFANLLTEAVGDTGAQDALTISQRLAEEKAKIKAKLEPAIAVTKTEPVDEFSTTQKTNSELDTTDSIKTASNTRPSIKTARTAKKNEITNK